MRSSLYLYTPLLVCHLLTTVFANEPSLTVYNQDFAVVRQTVPLELRPGINEIRFTETTTHLEPDSVILRDAAGRSLQAAVHPDLGWFRRPSGGPLGPAVPGDHRL